MLLHVWRHSSTPLQPASGTWKRLRRRTSTSTPYGVAFHEEFSRAHTFFLHLLLGRPIPPIPLESAWERVTVFFSPMVHGNSIGICDHVIYAIPYPTEDVSPPACSVRWIDSLICEEAHAFLFAYFFLLFRVRVGAKNCHILWSDGRFPAFLPDSRAAHMNTPARRGCILNMIRVEASPPSSRVVCVCVCECLCRHVWRATAVLKEKQGQASPYQFLIPFSTPRCGYQHDGLGAAGMETYFFPLCFIRHVHTSYISGTNQQRYQLA